MLAAENNLPEISNYILDQFPDVDINKIDSRLGNNLLHHLVRHGQRDLAAVIFEKNDRLALK